MTDILERAKAADIDLMASTDWGQLRDLFGELIAEVERLRSDQDAIMAAWDKDAVEHDARIKELEEANRNIDKRRDEMAAFIERLEAAFLVEKEATLWDTVVVEGPKEGRAARHIAIVQQKAREALEKIKNGND